MVDADTAAASSPPHVVVVEDEENIALALATVLGREGWQVTRLADGAGALEAIRAARPALVLLDVMLPNVSGYEICQQIRLDPALDGTSVLIMTARGTSMERRKGLALGADGFVSKPFDLRELMEAARRLVAGRPVRDAAEGSAGGGDTAARTDA
ncbi:MAG: response regulator [Paracoccaceae bacterium]|jgi:DNA-binding response OmpR family regulator|nr:response regulator [Paracoccaceae bacterium]